VRPPGWVRGFVRLLGIATLALPMTVAAASATYPDRPIRLIVPFAPGGGADTLGRMIAAALTESLGQSVVVDNRGGAGGTIGADIVAKSAPDGYTILFGSPGPLAVNPNLQSKMPYDVVKDFAPITQLSRSPIVVVLNPGVPVTSVRELVAAAKAKPGSLNFGSAGNGSIEHMSAELFKILAGVDMTHIPYKGTGPALTDLFGGRIQMLFENLPPVLQHIKAGKLRAIAVGTKDRSAFLPDLPTVAEAGVPGYEASSWFGLLLPAKAPAAVIRRLHGDAVAALRSPVFRERVSGLGAETVGSTPEQFREHMRDKLAEVAKIVKSSGMKIE
jgi:tripartite-type tricarboxylate transporter receptor subunit TctC